MGLGQSLLSALALALLGTIVLDVNWNTADNGSVIERTEYEIMATSLGTSVIERATGLAYDENTINSDISSATSCTPVASLGPEIGEVDSSYDDFDDFNGYNKVIVGDSLKFKSADFHITGTVQYVQLSGDSVVVSAGQTYNKLLTIRVWSSFMPDTLKFQTVYSYWYFR
jgi:MSHA pilin protein MshD